MARPKLTLFLDVVSPFAYLAFYVTENSPIFKQCDVTYVPVFLGGIMKATNNTPPINIKNKDKWINTERLRWANYASIPMASEMPQGFPPMTLQAMRALASLEISAPDKLPAAFAAIYNAGWVERQEFQKADVFGPVLETVLGKEAARDVLKRAGEAEAKERLLKNTERAIEQGAFGLPWFVATNSKGDTEGFWGFDHLGQVLDHLGLERGNGLKAML